MFRFWFLKCSPRKLLILLLTWVYLLAFVFIFKPASYEKSLTADTQETPYGVIPIPVGEPPSAKVPISAREPHSEVFAVLVLVCDRLTLQKTLNELMTARPNPSQFPIIVSQDCGKRGNRVKSLVKKLFGKKISYLTHPFYEDSVNQVINEGIAPHMQGYYHIAVHYGWALNYTFNKLGYENVIVVEDDLDIAPDFFEYFAATLAILKSDPTLWCVSAYNDNGLGSPLVIDEHRTDLLYRTDFFPGLGWMLTKSVWDELSPKWPPTFWDDWMRQPDQRKGRACIHPEISRTKTFGRSGTSAGQFFDQFLAPIKLNSEFVPFTKADLSYLMKEEYDQTFLKRVQSSAPISSLKELYRPQVSGGMSYKLPYRNQQHFTAIARKIGIMDDLKDGVARSSYMGIVSVMFQGKRLYLVPSAMSSIV